MINYRALRITFTRQSHVVYSYFSPDVIRIGKLSITRGHAGGSGAKGRLFWKLHLLRWENCIYANTRFFIRLFQFDASNKLALSVAGAHLRFVKIVDSSSRFEGRNRCLCIISVSIFRRHSNTSSYFPHLGVMRILILSFIYVRW